MGHGGEGANYTCDGRVRLNADDISMYTDRVYVLCYLINFIFFSYVNSFNDIRRYLYAFFCDRPFLFDRQNLIFSGRGTGETFLKPPVKKLIFVVIQIFNFST